MPSKPESTCPDPVVPIRESTPLERIHLAFLRMCHSVESDTGTSVRVDLALRGVTAKDFDELTMKERDHLVREFAAWVGKWQARGRK